MNFKLFIFAYILEIASAAIFRESRELGPGIRKGCYVESLGRYLKGGKMVEDVFCGRYECYDNEITITTCPVVDTDDPECKIFSLDIEGLVYPFCCPRITCGDESKQQEYDYLRQRLLASVLS
ncbi:uncharacterized protein LOC111356883 [Spodoptera litura]|uniref:Uncharacterized protein LOC111356883 n=1 Tax=Spodoptera litura TaxID=69820 RepID=A0A9J7E9Z5_SPOLT|nr:uncharacterized protein LOC111356883 [Spodoptera litura]